MAKASIAKTVKLRGDGRRWFVPFHPAIDAGIGLAGFFLVADCHKEKSGKTYPSVYGRMEWDKPSPTITTQFYGFGNGRFGHPEQDRAISLREGAILQSFPENYKFVKPKGEYAFKTIGRMIGNAVPVRLGEVVGKSIRHHLHKML